MAVSGYSGTPLVKKLGIKAGSRVVLVRPPDRFEDELAGLPDDVRLSRAVTPARIEAAKAGAPDLIVWFVTRRGDLDAGIATVARAMGAGLWIAWPKKASGVKTDLVEDLVRQAGLAHGIVDYKVCAIDATWSGLKFARRKT